VGIGDKRIVRETAVTASIGIGGFCDVRSVVPERRFTRITAGILYRRRAAENSRVAGFGPGATLFRYAFLPLGMRSICGTIETNWGIHARLGSCSAVERHAECLSGTGVFRGTRVPVSAFFANLEGGATVDKFPDWFPGVSLDRVTAVLEHAARSVAAPEAD
jgi:uncharacterized protein (DUF433 family)